MASYLQVLLLMYLWDPVLLKVWISPLLTLVSVLLNPQTKYFHFLYRNSFWVSEHAASFSQIDGLLIMSGFKRSYSTNKAPSYLTDLIEVLIKDSSFSEHRLLISSIFKQNARQAPIWKLLLFHKAIVRAISGDPEPPLRYPAIGLGSWGPSDLVYSVRICVRKVMFTRFKPKTFKWMSDKELNFSELNVEVFMDYSTERHKKSFVPVQLNHLMHSGIVTPFCT